MNITMIQDVMYRTLAMGKAEPSTLDQPIDYCGHAQKCLISGTMQRTLQESKEDKTTSSQRTNKAEFEPRIDFW